MLTTEGDADDGDAEYHAEDEVDEACPQSAEDEPEDVQRNADAAWRGVGLYDSGTEGPEAEESEFEGLKGNGDADDGAEECKAACEVADGSFESAEYPPEDVSYYFHDVDMVFGCLYYRYDEADAEVASHVADALFAGNWVGTYVFQSAEVTLIGAVEDVL